MWSLCLARLSELICVNCLQEEEITFNIKDMQLCENCDSDSWEYLMEDYTGEMLDIFQKMLEERFDSNN